MRLMEMFKVDGQPMIPPDAGTGFSFEDLDAEDSGRDESGVMHRIVIRHDVGKWSFTYSRVTDEEVAYLDSLFAGKSEFTFTHPKLGASSTPVNTTAYRSKHSLEWYNATLGEWRNYKFNIIEC